MINKLLKCFECSLMRASVSAFSASLLCNAPGKHAFASPLSASPFSPPCPGRLISRPVPSICPGFIIQGAGFKVKGLGFSSGSRVWVVVITRPVSVDGDACPVFLPCTQTGASLLLHSFILCGARLGLLMSFRRAEPPLSSELPALVSPCARCCAYCVCERTLTSLTERVRAMVRHTPHTRERQH